MSVNECDLSATGAFGPSGQGRSVHRRCIFVWQGGVGSFTEACQKLKVKAVLIANEGGKCPTQLMTASYHHGTLRELHLTAFRLSQRFVAMGFEVCLWESFSSPSNFSSPGLCPPQLMHRQVKLPQLYTPPPPPAFVQVRQKSEKRRSDGLMCLDKPVVVRDAGTKRT